MRQIHLTGLISLLMWFGGTGTAGAAELTPDGHTLLLLHFNDSLAGSGGETPATPVSGITFENGLFGSGAALAAANQLKYAREGNIDAQSGSLEFWIKTNWSGDDGEGHFILSLGASGGILLGKDGGDFWRCIFNRYAAGGVPEVGCGFYLTSAWVPGQWHHAAFTWGDGALKMYLDGELRAEQALSGPLPAMADNELFIGSDNGVSGIEAIIDELRISNVPRTDAEILDSFLQGLTVTGLSVSPESISLLSTWWGYPELTVASDLGPRAIPAIAAAWTSTAPAVAHVDSGGRIVAGQAGDTVLTASYAGFSDTVAVTVTAPALPPVTESIDPFLATPADCCLFTIPVVILRYLPTLDGQNVDPDETGWVSSLADLKARIDRMTIQTKFMLEEGSRFRGYRKPGMVPSIGYTIKDIVTVYEEFPKGRPVPWNPGVYFPDYNQILTRAGVEHYVDDLGAREIWIWGYHHGDIEQPESNMSSPLTGDISNSSRFNDDLPIVAHTYTVYGYNFTRSACESAHNHGHQLESILSHANTLQDGQADLFWKRFVGQDEGGAFITGRCGWTHMPPNTTEHYNYWSTSPVLSDIEDWKPDGTGSQILVNAGTWGDLAYAWPDGVAPDDLTQAQWYIYWMQNMPGYGNGIPHGSEWMTNWWEFTTDWDAAISSGLGLHAPDPTLYGDLDGDGLITATDPVVLAGYLCGALGTLVIPIQTADLKVDGRIRVSDLVVLQEFIAGQILTLPLRD